MVYFFLAFAAVCTVVGCILLPAQGAALIAVGAGLFAAGFAAACVLYVLWLALLALFVDKNKPQTRYNAFYSAVVHSALNVICSFTRIRIHVSGAEKLPEGRWLLVSNHRSSFDPIVTGWALRKRRLAFVSKPQNLKIPVVGRMIHKACYLSIDRESDREAMRAILAAVALLRNDETNIGIYPEGTRNTGEELLPFRNGAFKIAQRAKVPIVICRIRGTDEVRKRAPWRATDVALEILGVMPAEEVAGKKTNEIGDRVRECIVSGNY